MSKLPVTQVRLTQRIATRVKLEAKRGERSIPTEVNRALFLYYYAVDSVKNTKP